MRNTRKIVALLVFGSALPGLGTLSCMQGEGVFVEGATATGQSTTTGAQVTTTGVTGLQPGTIFGVRP